MSVTSAQHLVFVPGQRWISDAEIELGLGTILQCDRRSVTLLFNHNGETRVYSTSTAPLTRVIFSEGDQVTHQDGWNMRVTETQSLDGLLVYFGESDQGEPLELMETQLDSQIRFQGPRERLLTGQIDRNNEYMLRALSRQAQTRLAKDPMRGLRGPRVGLIPHQLYIAYEVGRRLAPRVLLADEVGLGKTIEAGLILHQQLITGRTRRALILVPGSLCHQWLVELLRRFGLPVTLVDADRAQATGAPFTDATIALASINWLTNDAEAMQQALAENWDLLIVDEAHHLRWSPDEASPEYECVRKLSEPTPGLLLLTATPEQSGEAGFFAQLQLLDPARYPNLEDFLAEEEGYRSCATAIARLEAQEPLEVEDLAALEERLSGDSLALLALLDNPQSSNEQRNTARQQLTEQLLDRYGTGRVLFRNRRASVPGFPERKVFPVALECPAVYKTILEEYEEPHKQLMAAALTGQHWPYAALYPERLYAIQKREEGDWWKFDPRVDWLLEKLVELHDEKVLLICAHADTALDLSDALRRRAGILAAVFHEDMPLIERDRAAAWFADDEDGAPILICSEIGSEGRNFQFAHHLVLFDLPAHPDLLEQRIGRLDRIGQTQTVKIHVPYLQDTAQAPWLAWCNEGLEQFTHPRPVGATLWLQYQDELHNFLEGILEADDFLPQVKATRQAAEIELEAGRHRLLELASHRPDISAQLVEQLADTEMDKELRNYLEVALDVYRIQNEDLDADTWYLKPGQESDTAIFTDVHFDMEEGSSGTFLRDKALARDDLHFLTWEHPLTRNCLEAATSTVQGNVTVALLKNPALPAGTLLLEVFFCLESTQRNSLDINRYLPPQSLRLLLDGQGNNLSSKVKFKGLSRQLVRMKKSLGREIVKLRKDQLRQLLDKAETLAEEELPSILELAQTDMRELLDPEIARLTALQQKNPAVRSEEIDQLVQLRKQLDSSLNAATLRLDALRVIVAGGQE
ncbi:MAG TPA: RNA polymerase-associated protein RapA [Marinospirillum sp.]|uniref:RNA polymerase-associated protein RapA n=1 Tax=Marinospirillum sp. TaxID=2183934 RepID=UPI002B45C95D|nr:RNA polymerase-associated protein RapA [Marinospirillum sp.]HKM16293.1 RNA polymerase-associated protein RapA [Marinospirillum sp.]